MTEQHDALEGGAASMLDAMGEVIASMMKRDTLEHYRRERAMFEAGPVNREEEGYTGHYEGCLAEAESYVERLRRRGYDVVPCSPTPPAPSGLVDAVRAYRDAVYSLLTYIPHLTVAQPYRQREIALREAINRASATLDASLSAQQDASVLVSTIIERIITDVIKPGVPEIRECSEVAEELRRYAPKLAAALTGQPNTRPAPSGLVDGWMPIETAPRDGTCIDVWADGRRFTNVRWGRHDPDSECPHGPEHWHGTAYLPRGEGWKYREPTHWRRIPGDPNLDATPSGQQGGADETPQSASFHANECHRG